MKDIDQKIREALRQEDSQLVEGFRDERSLHEMIIETFRSRHRWLHITSFFLPFVLLVLVFVFAYQFFHAESVRAMIAWAAGSLWSATAMGLFKLMFMMELNKNAITREIKRLELEVGQLSRRISQK